MENFKIRVNNEAESKEAQDLLFELGYERRGSRRKVLSQRMGLIIAGKNDGEKIITYSPKEHKDDWKDYEGKEISLSQLRGLVAQSKNKQGLISGADALRALADGKDVEYESSSCLGIWRSVRETSFDYSEILNSKSNMNPVFFRFRLKPRTITLNGIEIPAPFEPKKGERYWWINPNAKMGYAWDSNDLEVTDFNRISMGVYRIEEDVVKVVAALRDILNAKP